MKFSLKNSHELCNLGARKKESIEDSINTEKNRGYHYKHAFSYHWNAMRGFHYLMRMAHAINALSEFTKKLKQFIKKQGCEAVLKLIKETLFNPWLPVEWYEAQLLEVPQLRLYSG
jgi:myosin-crossreactive antigen